MAVLDTNFLIALEVEDENAIAWLDVHRTDEHHVPDFVAVEYLTGHTSPDEAFEALEAAFTIAHGTTPWVQSATRLRKRLRERKARFRSPDFWIAAWANYLGAAVVTRNEAHFNDLGVAVAKF